MEPDYPDGRSLYYRKAEDGKPGDDVLVNTGNGYVVKRLDDKKQLYKDVFDQTILFPKNSFVDYHFT